MTAEEKRRELRARIEAGETRHAERSIGEFARDAGRDATDFVKAHPLVAVAGVAAVGLAIGAMTRPGRRMGRAAGRRASEFAGYAGELGLAYASGLLDSASGLAQRSGERLEDVSEDMAYNARAARRKLAHRAGDTSDLIRHTGRKVAREAGRSMRKAKAAIER